MRRVVVWIVGLAVTIMASTFMAGFAIYQSAGRADGSFTQFGFTVADIEAEVAALRARGVVFEDYDIGMGQPTR